MIVLPRETVARWVGGGIRFVGILVATLTGAIIPGGPFQSPIAAASP